MEEINPHNYHASMFTVYFLLRRLFTGIILVLFVDNPMFSCTILMIFSIINFIYLTAVKPLATKLENRIERFNEICIYLCAQTYNVFCRAEGGYIFINQMGWTFMGVCSFNICSNVVLMIYNSIV